MAKSTRFTEKDLQALGLSLQEDGSYKQTKSTAYLMSESPKTIRNEPYNIEHLRTLASGSRARNEASAQMDLDAKLLVSFVNNNNAIYIPTNVASSKNSKEIGVFKKRNEKGQLESKYTLVESKASKRYRKETEAYYRHYKNKFLSMASGASMPIRVELTFIRRDIGRFDYINACQIIADLMADHGWIKDDCSEYFLPVFNPVVYYSKEAAGVIIKVLK